MDDNKRLIVALALSCGIFFAWNGLASYMGWLDSPKESKTVRQASGNASKPSPEADAPAAMDADPSSRLELPREAAPVKGRLIRVETPLYTAVFQENGGVLDSFVLKKYRESLEPDSPQLNLISPAAAAAAPLGLLIDGLPTWSAAAWTLEGQDLALAPGQEGTLAFVGEMGGVRMERRLHFSADGYLIREKLLLTSPVERKIKLAFTFAASTMPSEETTSIFSDLRYLLLGGEKPLPEPSLYNPTRVAWLENKTYDDEQAGDTLTSGMLIQGNVTWMGVLNNYFLGAASLADGAASAKGSMRDGVFHVLVGRTGVDIAAGQTLEEECIYFIGPKDTEQLRGAPNELSSALNYGFFSIIARPLVSLLQFFYGYAHNYGLAIIMLTILVKLIFWPLSQKSYKSMQQMKKLQPMMAKIREKHAGDKEAMNKEVMQLYKTYKVNPAGGCLPILVQIPVFFGLYQALLNATELRHAAFISHLPFTDTLWLADLSVRDPLFITPLIMGSTMFLQQKITPASGDPTQTKMMLFMPPIFTLLCFNFPAGLVLYWLVNNVISIFQQWLQLRKV
ncbi:MAG: membrane protein insertase YidC [Deltaproteobacteria bacterium]|jgi:YidC/Oxa1 family membrane protein insertase|nr:membrane protein insertase YidC [Deltaproteobacteria bacterium]